jgi:AraC-like DNA-binding protein
MISKHILNAPINDLSIIGGELTIGTSKGLYALKDSSVVEVIPNAEIVQSIPFMDKIVFINNSGLFSYFDGSILPLIENVEFNKMALYQDQHYLYAGSVHGLYVIEKSQLEGVLKAQPSKIKTRNYSIYYYLLLPLLFLFAALTILIIRRRKGKESAYPMQKRVLLDSEMIRNVVLNNSRILSVEHLAEHFNTSVVQLNRHLKKEGLTGLILLKSIKKEIALEMLKDGNSLEQISKRVGYSIRYVKTNFLKD